MEETRWKFGKWKEGGALCRALAAHINYRLYNRAGPHRRWCGTHNIATNSADMYRVLYKKYNNSIQDYM